MDNIYNKSDLERFSIVDLPEGYIEDTYAKIYSWLGSFWRNIHTGKGFVKGLQHTRAVQLAQYYVDMLEALNLQDRRDAPVFHRELWRPMVIRKSQRNTAQENLLKLGENDIVAGEQPDGSIYGKGTVLQLGRLGAFEKYVTYPVSEADGEVRRIASTIVDNPINPTVTLTAGTDFTFDNGSLIFPLDADPLGDESQFLAYDVVDDDLEGQDDIETVLWATDALVDKNFISDHMSYVIGIDAPSTDVVKRIVNAGWTSINNGLTPELLKTLMAAMLNIPVIQEDEEKILGVEFVEDDEEDYTLVTTDCNEYRVSRFAKLRDCVKVGNVLERGEFLDQSVKIYPFLTDPSGDRTAPDHIENISEYADILKYDVPVVDVPPALLRTRTTHGLYVTWASTRVKQSIDDPLDSNGNPHLYFSVYGTADDVDAFWKDIWDRAEAEGKSMEDYLGPVGTEIVPAEFFMKHMIGANTLIITVDRNQVDDLSLMRNPMFFDILSSVVPSAIRLFFIEHIETDKDEAVMDGLDEEEDPYAYMGSEDEVDYDSVPGLRGKKSSYGERVDMRLVRRNPRRGRNDEEW